jgi:hypothetical protein
MKRLNQRQQQYLSSKFAVLCDKFLAANRPSAKPPKVNIMVEVTLRPCWGEMQVETTSSQAEMVKAAALKSAACKDFANKYAEFTKLTERVAELKGKFNERLLFSSNDFEETNALFDQFKALIK